MKTLYTCKSMLKCMCFSCSSGVLYNYIIIEGNFRYQRNHNNLCSYPYLNLSMFGSHCKIFVCNLRLKSKLLQDTKTLKM